MPIPNVFGKVFEETDAELKSGKKPKITPRVAPSSLGRNPLRLTPNQTEDSYRRYGDTGLGEMPPPPPRPSPPQMMIGMPGAGPMMAETPSPRPVPQPQRTANEPSLGLDERISGWVDPFLNRTLKPAAQYIRKEVGYARENVNAAISDTWKDVVTTLTNIAGGPITPKEKKAWENRLKPQQKGEKGTLTPPAAVYLALRGVERLWPIPFATAGEIAAHMATPQKGETYEQAVNRSRETTGNLLATGIGGVNWVVQQLVGWEADRALNTGEITAEQHKVISEIVKKPLKEKTFSDSLESILSLSSEHGLKLRNWYKKTDWGQVFQEVAEIAPWVIAGGVVHKLRGRGGEYEYYTNAVPPIPELGRGGRPPLELPARTGEVPPQPGGYYVRNYGRVGKAGEWKSVSGEPITIEGAENLPLIVAETAKGKWDVVESRTGERIGQGGTTRAEAIVAAEAEATYPGFDKVIQEIEGRVSRGSVTPGFPQPEPPPPPYRGVPAVSGAPIERPAPPPEPRLTITVPPTPEEVRTLAPVEPTSPEPILTVNAGDKLFHPSGAAITILGVGIHPNTLDTIVEFKDKEGRTGQLPIHEIARQGWSNVQPEVTPTPEPTPTEPAPEVAAPTPEVQPEPTPTEPTPATESTPHTRLADRIAERLIQSAPLEWRELEAMANEHFGGTRAKGTFDARDLYDAVEVGINKYLDKYGSEWTPENTKLDDALAFLRKLESRIPTQVDRTATQIELQQFSTPPTEAYVATRALGNVNGLKALEPSAGTGSLARWLRQGGAQVTTNEFPGEGGNLRAKLLEAQGYPVIRVDAERIDALIPNKEKYDIIAMNPPFSATGGRVKSHQTAFGARHVQSALALLKPGGRLVAIVGGGMSDSSPTHADWFRKMREQYLYRANLKIDGSEYKKFGTTFDNRILVFDNPGPEPRPILSNPELFSDEPLSLEEAARRLEVLSNERLKTTAGQTGETGRLPTEQDVQGVDEEPRPTGRTGVGGELPSGTGERGGGGTGRPGGISGEEGTPPSKRGGGTTPRPTIPKPRGTKPGVGKGRGKGSKPSGTEGNGPEGGERPPTGTTPATPATGRIHRESVLRHNKVVSERNAIGTGPDDTFVVYQPAITADNPHPCDLVETSSMADVQNPLQRMTDEAINDLIHIPKDSLGGISDPQLEAVALAQMRHQQKTPEGLTLGLLIGDGTGVGKGREIAGVVANNWHQGNRRVLWVSKNHNDLYTAAVRDLTDVAGEGAIPSQRIDKWKPEQPINLGEGVVVAGYDTFKRKERLAQLTDWLRGGEGTPILVFDEAHMAANATVSAGPRGAGKPSARGLAVIEIQKKFPEARVVYATATAADRVNNLGYANRTGLWGQGTPFPNFEDFAGFIRQNGVGAMEMIARELKQQGGFVSRMIPFIHPDGTPVEFQEHVAQASPDMIRMYDKAAETWAQVLDLVENSTGSGKTFDKGEAARFLGQYWGAHQRFFKGLFTAFKAPDLIRLTETDLDAGLKPVVSLDSTQESAMVERINEGTSEGLELDEIDFSNKNAVKEFVNRLFPVQLRQQVTDSETGSTTWKPMWKDENGNTHLASSGEKGWEPVLDPEKVALRDGLMAEVGDLEIPGNPLDLIIEHFGPDNIAELTGRTVRYIRDTKTGQLVKQNRSVAVREREMNEFNAGERKIAIISRAAAEGISLHAGKQFKDQNQRVQDLFDLGWQTKQEIQKAGRTHRADQVIGPTYRLISIDIGGEKRFSSGLAAKLSQLGAIQRGDRASAGAGELSKYDYNSDFGHLAVIKTLKLIGRPTLSKMGLLNEKKYPSDTEKLVGTFFNRLMVLPVTTQNEAYAIFHDQFQKAVATAEESGVGVGGVEDLKAKSVKQVREEVVYTDKTTGSETKYHELEAEIPNKRRSWDVVRKLYDKAVERRIEAGYRISAPVFGTNIRSGGIALADPFLVDNITGTYQWKQVLHRPNGTTASIEPGHFMDAWEEVDLPEAETIWNEQLAKLPETRTETVHVVSGLTFPIFDRLHGDKKIVRVPLPNGERIVGVRLPEEGLQKTLRDLGVAGQIDVGKPADLHRAAQAMATGEGIELAGGLVIRKSTFRGDDGLEIVKGDPVHWERITDTIVQDRLRRMGLIEIESKWEKKYFIPDDGGPEVLAALLKEYPVVGLPDSIQKASQKKGTGRGSTAGAGQMAATVKLKTEKSKPTIAKSPQMPKDTGNPQSKAETEKAAKSMLSPIQAQILMPLPLMEKGLFQRFVQGIVGTVSTASLSEEAALAARLIREHTGHYARVIEVAWEQSKDRRKFWDDMDPDDRLDFWDRIETGQSVPPELQEYADNARARMDATYKAIKGIKPWVSYRADYLPHLYQNRVEESVRTLEDWQRSPQRGSRPGFLKQRKIPTLREAKDMGLIPLSENPEEMMLAHEAQVAKFLLAHRILLGLKGMGLAKFIPETFSCPRGWRMFKDNMFTVYGPQALPMREAFDAKMTQQIKDLIDKLGIKRSRKVKMRPTKAWGKAGAGGIETRFGGPEPVYSHELGHVLDERYDIGENVLNVRKGPFVKELRAVADLREAGTTGYPRKRGEKIAAFVHAYIHARNKLADVAPLSLAQFEQFIEDHPELHDIRNIAPSLVLGEDTSMLDVPGVTKLGQMWGPEEVVAVVNNSLSPSLWAHPGMIGDVYKAARVTANMMTQSQLGLSFFHAGFTTADVMISHVAMGLTDFIEGRGKSGALNLIKGFTPWGPIENALIGRKLQQEYLHPGTYPRLAGTAKLVERGGGRARLDRFWHGVGNDVAHDTYIARLLKGVDEKDPAAVAKALVPGILEMVAFPTMQKLVPWQKLGMFYKLMEQEVKRYPGATKSDMTTIAQRVWNAVDDRLGQVVYDNLFWNRMLRDVAMIGVRSVGWNFGSWRHLGGGALDMLTTGRQYKRGGKRWTGTVTPRQMYLIALPMTVAIWGAITCMVLGKRHPKELIDFFAPPTGEVDENGDEIRMQFSTYLRDIISLQRQGPVTMAAHKTNPVISEFLAQMRNEDWKGEPVAYMDDPLWQQMIQRITHAFESVIPMGIQNMRKAQSPRLKVAGFIGQTIAPKYVTNTPAESLMWKYMTRQGYSPVPTSAKAAQMEEYKRDLRRKIRDNSITGKDIQEAVDSGAVKNWNTFEKNSSESKEERMVAQFRRLDESQQEHVYRVANKDEKAMFEDYRRKNGWQPGSSGGSPRPMPNPFRFGAPRR